MTCSWLTLDGRKRFTLAPLFLLVLSLISTPGLEAQAGSAPSNKGAILLSATLPSQLRLSLSNVELNIRVSDPAQPSAVIVVPITSSWVLGTASNGVELVGFFDSPAAAFADGDGHVIPASRVIGGLATEEMMPFSEASAAGNANASRIFFRQQISRGNYSATRNDTLNIQLNRIDDLGAPAGDYRGVLHLRLISY